LAKHAWARRAAIAARFFTARDPKLGLEYRRETMAGIKETRAENFNEKLAAAVEKDFQDGVARGVARTPTVLVNGKPFVETFTFEEISREIEQALAEA